MRRLRDVHGKAACCLDPSRVGMEGKGVDTTAFLSFGHFVFSFFYQVSPKLMPMQQVTI